MRAIFIVLILFVTACSESLDDKIGQLVKNKNTWEKNGFGREYSYKISLNYEQWGTDATSTVFVKGGKVISVLDKDGEDKKVTPHFHITIREHFEAILELLKNNKFQAKIRYNELLGYPLLIQTRITNAFDGNSTISISNLEINKD